MRRRQLETLMAEEFRAALEFLGLSQKDAADVLRVSSRQRVNHWCTGKKALPPYIAAHVEALLRASRRKEADE